MVKISREAAQQSNVWVFKEALALAERFDARPPEKGYVLFETGYGPSGLPHIGTFAEVFRTTMVRQAFEQLSDIPTKLIAFSDDMDGLRKVPDNIPQQKMVAEHLGKPLTGIPDPFGTHASFGAHMNHRLQHFLDQYGFDYEFKSSTECYTSGIFDEALLETLRQYDKVMKIMLPTLGEERQQTYSPFLPLCPESGKVLQVPMIGHDAAAGTATFRREDGSEFTTSVTGGHCKLQWKPDWGMRWAALGIDYEMHGKDLTPSAVVSGKLCKVIGGEVPRTYVYEMFLDKEGTKISKSKGNGLSLEEWLTYGTPESLSVYLFNSPHKQKRLHFEVIPKSVDEYLTYREKLPEQDETARLANPVWHIHHGEVPQDNVPVSFSLLLNLASACNPDEPSVLWGFVQRYASGMNKDNAPLLDQLITYALAYYESFVKPNKTYRAPTAQERAAMEDFASQLQALAEEDASAETLQNLAFSVGKAHGFDNLRAWFQALYEVLLGQSQGPRIGSFIALYGVKETVELIGQALNGEYLAA